MSAEQLDLLVRRLERIENALEALLEQRAVKEWYTTAEVAESLNRSEYTVREWCRKDQAHAVSQPTDVVGSFLTTS